MDSVVPNPLPVNTRLLNRRCITPASPADRLHGVGGRDGKADSGGSRGEKSFRNRLLAHVQRANRRLNRQGITARIVQSTASDTGERILDDETQWLVVMQDEAETVLQQMSAREFLGLLWTDSVDTGFFCNEEC